VTDRGISPRSPLLRLFAGLSFFMLLATVLLAAVASAAPPPESPTEPAADSGVVRTAELAATRPFTVALSADVQGLDPALLEDSPSLLVTGQIYDTLVAYEQGGSLPVPALAESWSASADGKTWTFNLRPGIQFHDGEMLNAEAVVANLERWWDPADPNFANGAQFRNVSGGYKGDADCLVDAVGAAGPLQFQITTTVADSSLPTRLAMDAFAIASPAAIQAGTLNSSPAGTGPFRFIERVEGNHISLQANAGYWGTAPLLDELIFRVIPDAAQRYVELASGAVQSADGFDDDQVLAASSNPNLRVQWRAGASVGYLGINRAHTPLDDLRVRQAIAHAIRLPALISGYFGRSSQPADQFLPPVVWGRDAELTGYGYDQAVAKSLLAQAGYSGGFTTTLAYRDVYRAYLPDSTGTANAIAADLKAVGIDADVLQYESGEFLDKASKGELDLILLGWFADYLHPANFFDYHFCNPGNLAFGQPDAELCSQLATAANTFDIAAQLPIYTWASDRLYDTLPALSLAHQRSALITRFDVAGVVPSPVSVENYEVVHYAEAEAEVTPDDGGTVAYTDAGGQAVTATVPAGAVAEPVTLRLEKASTAVPPAGFGYGDEAFEITAYQDGSPLPGFAFDEPIILTVGYSDAGVARLLESTLGIYLKIGDAWVDAADTCTPRSSYAIDDDANTVSVAACHLTEFALFGEKKPAIYLPVIVR
jgi:peptide/nickel transport system substrate-binding protein